MIRRKSEQKVEQYQNRAGGVGQMTAQVLLEAPDEMYGKGRMFNRVILEPGASIGNHPHDGESETYYILKGTAEFSDNGTAVTLQEGDLGFTGSGESHSIKNIGEGDLEFIALILYK